MKNNDLADNVVETQDVTKTFGNDIAVRALNMHVTPFWVSLVQAVAEKLRPANTIPRHKPQEAVISSQ